MFKVTCQIIEILPEEVGRSDRGDWVRRSIIVQYGDEWPRKLCITATNEGNAAILGALRQGEMRTIGVAFSSREREGRWFTDCRFVRLYE